MVQLLLRNGIELDGVEVNHIAEGGYTPLYRGCQGGHLDTVRTLLQSGADRLGVDDPGEIPLHKASKGSHIPIVHLLLGQEPVVRATQLAYRNMNYQVPRDLALNGAHYDLSKVPTVNYQVSSFQYELESTIKASDSDRIKAILRAGVIPDQPDGNELTPSHQAISETQYQLALILLEHGARIDHPALNGWKPLHTACKRGHLDCVQLCVKKGAQIMLQGHSQRNPLHKACQGRNIDVVRPLIGQGANIAAVESKGFTAMHDCAEGDYEETALFMSFKYQVSLTSRTVDGRTPQAVASEAGFHALPEFFRAHR